MIQNISTIVTLTNANKSEKYSNEVRSDLDLRTILPTSLSELTLDETLAPPPPSPPSLPNSAEDDSNSDEEQ